MILFTPHASRLTVFFRFTVFFSSLLFTFNALLFTQRTYVSRMERST